MKLKQGDIINRIRREKGKFALDLTSPLFREDVRVTIFAQTGNSAEEITPFVTDCVNAILNTKTEALIRIKKELYRHYKVSIEETSYMMVPNSLLDKHDGDEALANEEYFEYKNEEDSFQGARPKEFNIVDYKQMPDQPVTYMIHFEVPWDDEHGISFLMNAERVVRVQ